MPRIVENLLMMVVSVFFISWSTLFVLESIRKAATSVWPRAGMGGSCVKARGCRDVGSTSAVKTKADESLSKEIETEESEQRFGNLTRGLCPLVSRT